jgi:hypothetical protein
MNLIRGSFTSLEFDSSPDAHIGLWLAAAEEPVIVSEACNGQNSLQASDLKQANEGSPHA